MDQGLQGYIVCYFLEYCWYTSNLSLVFLFVHSYIWIKFLLLSLSCYIIETKFESYFNIFQKYDIQLPWVYTSISSCKTTRERDPIRVTWKWYAQVTFLPRRILVSLYGFPLLQTKQWLVKCTEKSCHRLSTSQATYNLAPQQVTWRCHKSVRDISTMSSTNKSYNQTP